MPWNRFLIPGQANPRDDPLKSLLGAFWRLLSISRGWPGAGQKICPNMSLESSNMDKLGRWLKKTDFLGRIFDVETERLVGRSRGHQAVTFPISAAGSLKGALRSWKPEVSGAS